VVATRETAATTRLSSDGCAVGLRGPWSAVKKSPEGGWTAELADGSEAISVLRVDWRRLEPPSQWRPALDAIVEVRRGVDREQNGPRTVWSATEFFDHATNPGEMYTYEDPNQGACMATLLRASQSHACMFLVWKRAATKNAFLAYARAVMRETEATE
jgi:hypothetical protein